MKTDYKYINIRSLINKMSNNFSSRTIIILNLLHHNDCKFNILFCYKNNSNFFTLCNMVYTNNIIL